MALKRESLKKFLKTLKLKVVSVKQERTEPNEQNPQGSEILTLELAEQLDFVEGTQLEPTSARNFRVNNVRTVIVAGDDIATFMDEAEEDADGKHINYEGTMTLDVSKPKVNRNGEVSVPSRVFLTSVPFNRRGTQLRQKRANVVKDNIANYLKQQYGSLAEAPQGEKVEVTAG